MTVVSTAWSPTVGWVSNPPPLAEPSCLGAGIDLETGNEIVGPGDGEYGFVENTGVGAWSETLSSGEILKSTKLFQWNVGEKNLVTHLVLGFESISIDDGEGARDKLRREDNFPLKDPAILCMRLVSDGFLLDMMIVKRENRNGPGLYKFALPTARVTLCRTDSAPSQVLEMPVDEAN